MLKFIGGSLAAIMLSAGAAQAAELNQWQAMPQKQRPKAAAANDSAQKDAKPRRRWAERLRLINIKDKNHKLILACSANSGRLQVNALLGGAGEAMPLAAAADGEKRRREKAEKTAISLTIDGKIAVKDSPGHVRRNAHGAAMARANLQSEAMTQFLSQFLTAKKTVAVSFSLPGGKTAAESFTATNALPAGRALQNCLHK